MIDQISMAFLVLLQRLTPAERAVLLLRDVFDRSGWPNQDDLRLSAPSVGSHRRVRCRARVRWLRVSYPAPQMAALDTHRSTGCAPQALFVEPRSWPSARMHEEDGRAR